MFSEVWKDVFNYVGLYQVSNRGRVRSLPRVGTPGKILKPGKNNKGYLYVGLCKDGSEKSVTVHRLVAEAFIPNPDNLPEINHKDEDKTNNVWTNIEWCSSEYNHNYGTRNERHFKKMMKKVCQYTLSGELVKVWDSVRSCETEFGKWCSSGISLCCNGKRPYAYGYLWRYE